MQSTKISPSLISGILSDINIDRIALETGFTKDAMQSKVSGSTFVTSFWLMISECKNTLSSWASKVSQLSNFGVSEQGIEHKIRTNGVEFAKCLFKAGLETGIRSKIGNCNDLFATFPAVYIEDSSCLAAHPQLSEHYRGSYAKKEQHATVKLHITFELRHSQIANVGIGDFRKNDQSTALDILDIAKAGSLVLRDLGYFALEALKQMQQKGLFFISRLKPGVNVYAGGDEKKKTDLHKFLEKHEKNGIVDTQITLGAEHRCRVRIVAQRLPQEVAARRRQKAKEDRSAKANHSEEYYQLLGWCIIVTNVAKEVLAAAQIIKAYACRWRIEILFKAWKSAALNIQEIFKQRMSLERFEVTVYLALLYITQFCQVAYSELDVVIRIKTNEKSMLSLLLTYRWLTENLSRLSKMESIVQMANYCLKEVMHLCTYKKRRDRQNFADLYT